MEYEYKLMMLLVTAAPHAYSFLKEKRYMTTFRSILASLMVVVLFCAIGDERWYLWVLGSVLLGGAFWATARFDVNPDDKKLLELFRLLDKDARRAVVHAVKTRSVVIIQDKRVFYERKRSNEREPLNLKPYLVRTIFAKGFLEKIGDETTEWELPRFKQKGKTRVEIYDYTGDAVKLVRLLKQRAKRRFMGILINRRV